VDDFKRINRSYGYEAGTAALVHLASVIKDETRLIDIIARIGGEEFAVILPDTDLNGAKTVANRVKEKIKNQPFRLAAGAEIKITSTVAAGQYSPQVHKSGEGLLIRLERLLAHKGENGDSVIIEN
jgi:diguanylate cyclase (GGDEF)-like protein